MLKVDTYIYFHGNKSIDVVVACNTNKCTNVLNTDKSLMAGLSKEIFSMKYMCVSTLNLEKINFFKVKQHEKIVKCKQRQII